MDIAVIHRDLLEKGGGETVAMNVLEAVQDDFDVTLITLVEPPFDELNKFYNTGVDPEKIDVETVGRFLEPFRNFNVRILEVSLLNRYVNRVAGDYDILFSTSTDILSPKPMIHYIHHPRPLGEFYIGDDIGLGNPLSLVYHHLCARFSGFEKEYIENDKVLTCSEWVLDKIESVYGRGGEILYPPMDAEGLDSSGWKKRENGFLSIGRLRPTKKLLRNIEIIDRLRENGHETHLHIIGPEPEIQPNVYGGYYEKLKEEVGKRDYIYLEEDLDRQELVEMINTHRYGLHGKENEQFGIAVAEMVAGGMIPFVHDSGGQVEIVGRDSRLLYSTQGEAAEKIETVMEEPGMQEELREKLENQQDFRPETFQKEIRKTIDDFIEENLDD